MQEISIEQYKKQIAEQIKKKFDMSITEFSNSDHADILAVTKSSLRAYLSKSGNVSLKVLQKVAIYVDLPIIKREVIVSKKYKYYLNESNQS